MAATKYYCVVNGRVPGIYNTWNDCKQQVDGFKSAKYKSFGSMDEANEYMASFQSNNSAHTNTNQSDVQQESRVIHKTDEELADIKAKAYEHIAYLKDNNLILDDTYDTVMRQIDTNIKLQKDRREYDAISPKSLNEISPSASNHIDVYVDGSYNATTNEYGCGVYMNDGRNSRILVSKGECLEGGRNVEGEVAASRLALDFLKDKHYDSITLHHDYEGIGAWGNKQWSANKGYTKAYTEFVEDCRKNHGMNIAFNHVDGHTGVQGNEYVDKLAKIACGIQLTGADKAVVDEIRNVKGFPSDNNRDIPVSFQATQSKQATSGYEQLSF